MGEGTNFESYLHILGTNKLSCGGFSKTLWYKVPKELRLNFTDLKLVSGQIQQKVRVLP